MKMEPRHHHLTGMFKAGLPLTSNVRNFPFAPDADTPSPPGACAEPGSRSLRLSGDSQAAPSSPSSSLCTKWDTSILGTFCGPEPRASPALAPGGSALPATIRKARPRGPLALCVRMK